MEDATLTEPIARLREDLDALDRAYSPGHHGLWSARRRAELLDAALAERDLPRVELSVDAASPTGAVSLYEGLGMRAVRSYASFDGPSAA